MRKFLQTTVMFAMIVFMSNHAKAQIFTYPVKGKQGFNLTEKTRDGLHISYNLGQMMLNQINYRGEEMSEISISAIVLPNIAGCPNIPVESRLLAIPQGATAKLNVLHVEKEIIRNVNIAPALHIQAEDEVPDMNYVKDMNVYGKNAFFPKEPFDIGTSYIRGVDAATVTISPFQYNPVTKDLVVYTNVELSVTFEGGNGHFGDDRLRSPYWDPILTAELMNYDQLPVIDYAARMQQWLRDGADGAEYLIITPNNDDWAEYANQLRDYRTRQGILTKVYRLDEMPASSTNEMKTWFHNAYNNWEIKPAAVCLFGDFGTDMSQYIPAETINHPSSGTCISDNQYADVNGDNLPDMVFSRLVAQNASELPVFVGKQIEYEYTNPNMDSSFYSNPITALGWQTVRWFQLCSEVVGGYMLSKGYTPNRINCIYEGTPSTEWSTAQNTEMIVSYFGPNGLNYIPQSPAELGGWTNGTPGQVVQAVNSGVFWLQHRDHGEEIGWGEPAVQNSHVAQMNNVGKLPFVMSINCLTGKFNYESDCFAEAWMRRTYNGENAGAVGILCPTEISYSFVNDAFVWGVYDLFDGDFMPDYGPYAPASVKTGNWMPAFGNVAGKYFLQQTSWPYNTNEKDITYSMFTAHCDAFLRVYTQVPQSMEVVHPETIVAGVGEMDITAPQGCMISLVKQNDEGGWDIIAVAESTGSPQTVQFEPQLTSTEINLVVTGQNYLRYEAVIIALPAEGSYLAVVDYSPSSTPVNQETLLNITIKDIGMNATSAPTTVTLSSSDDRLSILDGTAQLGILSPNESVTLTNEFSFLIDEYVEDKTRFQINVTMICGTETWMGKVFITADKAVLSYKGMVWDGGFVPGETITVGAKFKNTGHYLATNAVATMSTTSSYITISNPTVNLGDIAVDQEVTCQFTITIASDCPETAQLPVSFMLTADGGLGAQGNEILKNSCNVIFALADSYSGNDGWNDAKLTVSFDDGTPSQDLTIASGSNSATYILEIGNGVHVTLTWTKGSYDSECSFTVSYEGDLVIYQMPTSSDPSAGVIHEFDCHCAAATQTFIVTATSIDPEQGIVSGGGEYSFGQTCTVTATPANGYYFVGWWQDSMEVSNAAIYSFNVTSDMDLVAHFAEGMMILIGDGGETTNQYLPSYNYYKYMLTQQIYTVEELGSAGIITSIAFYNGGTEKVRTYDFYMKYTKKTSFTSATDWEVVSESNKVFSGVLTMAANAWTFITFDTPFVYDGMYNVVLVADDNSGAFTGSPHMACRVFDASSQAIRIYNDNTNYNPFAPEGYNGTVINVKNQILLTKVGFSECMNPTRLTATEVGPDFVKLSWTENGASEQWFVVCSDRVVTAYTNQDFILDGLDPATEYTIIVRPDCDENLFSIPLVVTTLDACPAPQDVDVDDITHAAATVTWVGYTDSYNVCLGIPDTTILYNVDFADVIPAEWSNSSDYPWIIVNGHMQSGNASVSSSTSSIMATITFPADGTIEFDAECKGEGISTYWDHCDFYIDGTREFYAGANISGWHHYSFDVAEGEHTFIWSYTKDGSMNPTGDYFAVDNVLMKIDGINWDYPVSVSNDGYRFTGLTPVTTYCVRVQGICGDTESEWSEIITFTTVEAISVTQTVALSAGWSWWSTYVEMEGVDGLTMLEESLGSAGVIIKSSTSFVQNYYDNYGNNFWMGSLNEEGLYNEVSYRINTSASCTTTLNGVLTDPADHPIALHSSGWTWIGYPCASEQSLSTAFVGFTPTDNDVFKSQYGFAIYSESFGWFPEDLSLVPGHGYMYKSNATEVAMLTFANGRTSIMAETEESCQWQNDVHAYVENQSVVAVVTVDGIEQKRGDVEIGAFVNGECRGSARLSHFEPIDRWYAMLTVSGMEGEQVEFRLFDRENAQYGEGSETIVFHSNAVEGSLDDPMVMRFGALTDLTEIQSSLDVYPNPVNREELFTLSVPEGEMVTEMQVYNVMGETVAHRKGVMERSVMSGLSTSGIYMLKVVCKSGNVYQCRIVVK